MRHYITPMITHEHGGTYKVTLEIPFEKGWIEEVKFYIWRFGTAEIHDMKFVKNEGECAFFEAEIDLWDCTLYQYYFSFFANGNFQYYKKHNYYGDTNVEAEECFELAVNFSVPDWAKGANGYQIFPDRFCRGKGTIKKPMPRRHLHENWDELPEVGPDEEGIYNNDFFGGDFVGIKEKVPYIADLGITVVYFNPIVRSQSTHRYDAANYFEPDPYLGTVEELKEMIDEFHKHEIRVILDGVFNHTGNDSIYYNQYGTYDSIGAYQGPDSPFKDFFDYKDGKLRRWWNFPNMLVWNKDNLEFRKMICGEGGAIDKWCSWGIDGLRLDVADELPDDFLMEINQAMRRNRGNDFIIYLEVWEDATKKGKTYLEEVNEGHTPMNYYFTNPFFGYYKYGEVDSTTEAFYGIRRHYPVATRQTLMNSTSTHDHSRYIDVLGSNVFNYNGEHSWDIDFKGRWDNLPEEERNKRLQKHGGDEEKAFDEFREDWQRNYVLTEEQYNQGKRIMKSHATALAFMPGMFTIFYGDEVGKRGIGNLLNRGTYPWGHEDLELLEFYKRLFKSRRSEEFLKEADVRIVRIDQNQFVYERFDDNEKAIVIASRVDNETEIVIPEEYENAKIVFSTGENSNTTLAPYGAIVLKK